MLGLLQQDPQAYLQHPFSAEDSHFTPEEIERLIQQRLAARKMRDFAQADSIRQQLLEAGIVLEDGAQGTTWRRQ
jgi:cysteinyl-tRNA synthetase